MKSISQQDSEASMNAIYKGKDPNLDNILAIAINTNKQTTEALQAKNKKQKEIYDKIQEIFLNVEKESPELRDHLVKFYKRKQQLILLQLNKLLKAIMKKELRF